MKESTSTWISMALLTVYLIVMSTMGCQPTQIPTQPSPTAPSTTETLTPIPFPIPSLIPSPTSFVFPPPTVVFPPPRDVPVEMFHGPLVEQVETHHLYQGTWTTYVPQDWTKQFQHAGEFPDISSITLANDGTLWFATSGGVVSGGVGIYHFDGKTWEHYITGNVHSYVEFSSSALAPDGAIWFATLCCGIYRFGGKSWTNYTMGNGLPENRIDTITFARDGALWVGTLDTATSRFDGKSWQYFPAYYGSLWGPSVGRIFVLPDNSLLFSTSINSSIANSAKLVRFDGQQWTNYPTPWTEEGKYTEDMAAAPNGDLWFATEASGVYRLSKNTWTHFTTKDGLASDIALNVAVARDGTVWLGTVGGASRFDGKKWTTFILGNDPSIPGVGPIVAAPDGSVWVGYYGGIARYLPSDSP
ncbi:MAG: two-component regulator propeller domain-containing protein [Anaerolineales bacterium]